MTPISKAQIVRWLEKSAAVLQENKEYLTDLDSAIGDADHGINMARGFGKVAERLPDVADKDIGNLLKAVGMTLISTVGGASGPLYGTAFMRMGGAVMAREELTGAELAAMLAEGMAGIVQRGRAVVGDKTMVDVWTPAIAAINAAVAEGKGLAETLAAGVKSAETGLQATIPMQARKGRASYLGERSIGHQDPGGTSTLLLLKTLHEVVSSSQ
jgi:dihydroxyacetone kinase-like protein